MSVCTLGMLELALFRLIVKLSFLEEEEPFGSRNCVLSSTELRTEATSASELGWSGVSLFLKEGCGRVLVVMDVLVLCFTWTSMITSDQDGGATPSGLGYWLICVTFSFQVVNGWVL